MSKRRTGRVPIHREIKRRLGYKVSEPDSEILKHWKAISTRACKPCWELRYCPYGPLVEQSPLLPPKRSEAVQHNEYLKRCLETGKLGDGRAVDPGRRRLLEQEVTTFRPRDYPETIPAAIDEMQCTVFGHICPVVFSAEGFSETAQGRRTGRYIPFRTKMRVVRRDNHTCEHCGKHLKDNEVEFDHVIPLAKGGSSDEHNIRLTCHDCNRDKSDKIDL
jgi:hypothetical protein